MPIFTLKTVINREDSVVHFISHLFKDFVKAIVYIPQLRGYVFIETDDPSSISQNLRKVPHIRGKLRGSIGIEELDKFLIPSKATEGFAVDDIVEIIDGTFKGETCKITRVNKIKDEVTLEFLESFSAPIPITVKADYVIKTD